MNDETIEALAPWFYEFDLGPYGRTESKLIPEVRPIHNTRLAMINKVLDAYLDQTSAGTLCCLDIGCHEGFYSVELAKRGFKHVLGVDARERSLQKARFVSRVLGLTNTEFQQMNAEDVSPALVGHAQITLFLGLLYHLENPMLCLRRMASVTDGICILETQVIDEVDAVTERGTVRNREAYKGVLALLEDSVENMEAGTTSLVMCPSRRAVVTMLKHAGFARTEFIDPPPGAYEQHARGKRVVCAAYK